MRKDRLPLHPIHGVFGENRAHELGRYGAAARMANVESNFPFAEAVWVQIALAERSVNGGKQMPVGSIVVGEHPVIELTQVGVVLRIGNHAAYSAVRSARAPAFRRVIEGAVEAFFRKRADGALAIADQFPVVLVSR